MNRKIKSSAQLFLVLLCALGLKLYYSMASPDQLRWILAPTTWLVELISGRSFSFEAHAGYMSSDHMFLIAASCAGVNFLVTLFLMLALRVLLFGQRPSLNWYFIPRTLLFAYLATLIANSIRICIALELQRHPPDPGWLTASQLHRAEGIIVYFGFLLMLFLLTGRTRSRSAASLFRQTLFPLLIYYAVTLGLPLANGAYRRGPEFWSHSIFVLVIPMGFIAAFMMVRVLLRARVAIMGHSLECADLSALFKRRRRGCC